MAEKKPQEPAKEPAPEAAYSKEKLLSMQRFRDRQDLLTALLEDTRTYTIAEADSAIENFMKGGINTWR